MEAWAREAEDKIERGKSAVGVEADASTTFGFVTDLHMRDLAEVGKSLLRGKAYERVSKVPRLRPAKYQRRSRTPRDRRCPARCGYR